MSALENELALQLKAAGISFQREVRFAAPRRWRADFLAWSGGLACGDRMTQAAHGTIGWERKASGVLVEVEGSSGWQGFRVGQPGSHRTVEGFHADCLKYGTATALGWRVIRCTPQMVRDGTALALIEVALELKPPLTLQAARAAKTTRKPSRFAKRTQRASKDLSSLPPRVQAAAARARKP